MYSGTEKYASPFFMPVDLSSVYTHAISTLGPGDCGDKALQQKQFFPTGESIYWGIPFKLGPECGENNVLILKNAIKSYQFKEPTDARYIVFLHAADYKEDSPCEDGIYRPMNGNDLRVAFHELIVVVSVCRSRRSKGAEY